MSALAVFFLVFLAIVATIIIVALYYVRKGVRFFRRLTSGNLTDEELKRVTDRIFSSKKNGGAQQQNRTTRTTDGVTVVDKRDPSTANKKIFAQDEGEYVDFKEV